MSIENILSSCPLNHTAHFLPAVQEAPSSLPTALALLFCVGVGAYAIQSLYGRCCAQTVPSVRPPQIVTARPTLHRTDTAKRVEIDRAARVKIDRAARADWHGTDIKKRVAALGVFGKYLTQDTHSREGIPMIQQAIVSEHEEIRSAGCAIFDALFLQNKGYFEAITAIMDGYATDDPKVHDASDLSLGELFTPDTLLPMLSNHTQALRQTYSKTQMNFFVLKVLTHMALIATHVALESAFTTAVGALNDKSGPNRQQAVAILTILFARNFKQDEIRALCAIHQAPELAVLRSNVLPEAPSAVSARQRAVRRLEAPS